MKTNSRTIHKTKVARGRFFRPRGEQLEGRELLAGFVVNDLGDGDDYDLTDSVCSASFHLVGDPGIVVPNLDCTLRAARSNADKTPDLDAITFGVPAGSVIATNAIGFAEPVNINGGAGKIVLTSTWRWWLEDCILQVASDRRFAIWS